jgi:uncharacterized surface protein with fasciclin (FAS1) repeats
MKNLSSFYSVVGCALLWASILSGCMDSDDVGESYRTFEGEMVASYVSGRQELKEFEKALRMAGAYELLESYGKYTCFVPNDEAMEKWYAAVGKRLEQMDTADVREMVYYQLIDGQANAVDAYMTEDFPEGSFPVQNMLGRYLTASVQSGSGVWGIKTGDEYADIVNPNNEMLNGVVHITDRVLEGNNDMLPDFVANNPRYSIFGQALLATGWRDSMMVLEDASYEAPLSTTLPGGTEVGSSSTGYYQWPTTKKYLYTCFAESDSIMFLREGIRDLDGLRAYAKQVYPEGADIEDETDPRNSLHKFVGYHLYDVQRPKNKLVINKYYVAMHDWFTWYDHICDEEYRVEQYYVSMQPNMLLYVQNANTVDKDNSSAKGVPVLNCPYTPYNPLYTSAMTMQDSYGGKPIIRILNDEADQYCQNGVLHGLNNMLVYSDEVKADVFHRRIRMDVRTFLSEGVNNSVIYDGDKGYNWYITSFPDGYFKNVRFTSNNTTYITYEGCTPHDYLHGDHFTLTGNFDFTMKVGPIPKGSYEVRLSFATNTTKGAVVQAYLDGMPCGIPIDSRMAAYSGDTGWIQDWLAIQESGSSRFAGMGESEEDPYGLENDKNLRNHGYMKAPNCYVGTNYHNLAYGDNLTARNVDTRLRKILNIVNWTEDGTHELRLVAMRAGDFDVDFIEFMPTDLLENEDQH